MPIKKTRIAVAGAGTVGRMHIALAQGSPRCALSAVVDPSPAAQCIAQAAGVPWFTSLHDLLAFSEADGVVLATPNHLHVPQALQCIEAGLPILLEKPIATSVAQGTQLLKVVQATGARVLIGHHRAHSPIMAQAKVVVDSGRLGQLVAIMGSATFFKPDEYFDSAPWRREKGAGPILINMIHEVHNLRMLCGEVAAVQAFASHAARGFEVEDTVAINLRFASGVLGTFLLSDTAACPRSWEQTSQENPAYTSYADEDCYVIIGTHGSLSVPTMRLKTFASDALRSWWQPFDTGVIDLVRDDPLKHQLEHFGAVIRGEAVPRVSAHDGLQNLRVTEAIADAARTGQIIHL